MSRREDLESLMRERYQLLRRCEQAFQISNDPAEILRAGRAIDEQLKAIHGCIEEYLALTSALDTGISPDIAQIIQISEIVPQK